MSQINQWIHLYSKTYSSVAGNYSAISTAKWMIAKPFVPRFKVILLSSKIQKGQAEELKHYLIDEQIV